MFRELTVAQKIGVLVLVSCAAYLLQAAPPMMDHWHRHQRLQAVEADLSALGKIHQLLHSLQVERDQRVVTIHGVVAADVSAAQRELVDRQLQSLQEKEQTASSRSSGGQIDLRGFAKLRPQWAEGQGKGHIFGSYQKIVSALLDAYNQPFANVDRPAMAEALRNLALLESSKDHVSRLGTAVTSALASNRKLGRQEKSTIRRLFILGTNLHKGAGYSLRDPLRQQLKSLFDSQTQIAAAEIVTDLLSESSDSAVAGPQQYYPLQTDAFERLNTIIGNELTYWQRQAFADTQLSQGRLVQQAAWMMGVLLFLVLLFRWLRSRILAQTRSIIDTLNGTAQGISKVRSELQSSTRTVMERTHEAATALEQTSSTMAEMSSMVSQTAQKASEAEKSVDEVNKRTHEGTKSMKHMVECMESIFYSMAKVQQASESIKSVTESQMSQITDLIGEISSKTEIIHDLVLKTQLLSFNASIEAARAGPHGKGFAVVAQEVGNLAKTSGKAAGEIEELIHNSRKQVDQIIRNTIEKVKEAQDQVQDTREKVNQGKQSTSESMNVFREISSSSESILKNVRRVSEANSEQEKGIQQITLAIGNIDRTTQTNTNQSKHAAGMAHKLNRLSEELNDSIGIFYRLITANVTSPEAPLARDREDPPKTENMWEDDHLSEDEVDKKLVAKLSADARNQVDLESTEDDAWDDNPLERAG